jgi:hypothetical protein
VRGEVGPLERKGEPRGEVMRRMAAPMEQGGLLALLLLAGPGADEARTAWCGAGIEAESLGLPETAGVPAVGRAGPEADGWRGWRIPQVAAAAAEAASEVEDDWGERQE